ncbi:hypothetical protein [Nocardia sp. NPDC050406]|uniref:hypothetical protein n=1 Tax=Nocardia sp. NPDC050406 TaxID=3364318 RepID=UPI0037A0D819
MHDKTFPVHWPHDLDGASGRELAAALTAIIDDHPATMSEQYFADCRRHAITLACTAPDVSPPRTPEEFLLRPDPVWLKAAWKSDPHVAVEIDAMQTSRPPVIPALAIAFRHRFADDRARSGGGE